MKQSVLSLMLALCMLIGMTGAMAVPAAAVGDIIITGLDAPCHNGALDRTFKVTDTAIPVSVSYKMFGRDLGKYAAGDLIGVEVRVRSADGSHFVDGCRAYWSETGLWSQPLTKVSKTEAVYTFPYTVQARPDQIIDTVTLEVNEPVIGARPDEMNAYSMTPGIEVTALTWDPSPAKFEEASAYTAKVKFCLADEAHVFADDFAQSGTVLINGKPAALAAVKAIGTGKDKFAPVYYTASLQIPARYGASAGGAGDMPEEAQIFDVTYCDDITLYAGESATVTMLADLDFMLTMNLQLQWYESTSPYYGTGTAIPGETGITLEVAPDAPGDYYYYCVITGDFDGRPHTSVHAEANMCRVTVEAGSKPPFEIRPADDDSYRFVYSPDEELCPEVVPFYTGGKDIMYKWYECDQKGNILDGRMLGNGQALLLFGLPEELLLVPKYYLCVAECGGETDAVIFTCMLCPPEYDEPMPMFRVTAAEEERYDEALGAYLYTVYTPDEEIVFETAVTGTDGREVTYEWYECDSIGNVLSMPIGSGQAQLLFGIPQEKMMQPLYYRCSATCGGVTRYVIFAAMLLPMGVEEEPYVFPFGDVPTTEWYYTYVEQANKLGLINGKSADTYAPNMNMTWAEAIKLACCLNLLDQGFDPNSLGNGPIVWYSTYMDYALANGILDKDMSAVADTLVTRGEYVTIFARALPDSVFGAKNTIPADSIPDVAGPSSEQEKAIYKFYRAGIVNGTDAYGTFKPDDNVIRAEVAAILVRIMAPENRVAAPAMLGK